MFYSPLFGCVFVCVWIFIDVTLVYNIIQISVEPHCFLGSYTPQCAHDQEFSFHSVP